MLNVGFLGEKAFHVISDLEIILKFSICVYEQLSNKLEDMYIERLFTIDALFSFMKKKLEKFNRA